jgi:uncharacterized protein (DUF1697 family)
VSRTSRSVAFLRAVNVGGQSLPMAELRLMFERLGARDVSTYIQSGNVVFDPPARAAASFADSVERALHADFGLRSAVVVRSGDELRRVLNSIPFPAPAHRSVHVGFFKSAPPALEIGELLSFDAGKERVVVKGRECFLYLPDGVGRAKLPVRVNKLSTPVTIRNLRTLTAIEELASR